MYTKKNYGFWMTLNWSKKPFIFGGIYAITICLITYFTHLKLILPWSPIGTIGTAVAFYLGFKNNSSYDRTWEARKIWGSIVNNSRSFGAAVLAFVQGENEASVKKELIYRHIAWLTALRHQLRLSKPWEHTEKRIKGMYAPNVSEDYYNKLATELHHYISPKEYQAIAKKSNLATQILSIQSSRLQNLKDQGYFEDFRHIELHQLITSFYTDQGKSERIKGFPLPRQYASTALWLTFVFCALVPFGLIDIFIQHNYFLWICPFVSALIIWVFFLMEKIGDYSENPFEGTYNDVPITAIANTIEIDLREMINDTNIPEPIISKDGFLM